MRAIARKATTTIEKRMTANSCEQGLLTLTDTRAPTVYAACCVNKPISI
jgi:hypothetical protein